MDEGHVIKIGGSLFGTSGDIIHDIISSGKWLIIVPGGGPFIDLTERCGVGNEESHWMAIAGMEQYGWYLSSFGIPAIDRFEMHGKQSVFLPYRIMREEDPLPHGWNISSDSIAAWIAWRLGKKLILLKSVDGISTGGCLASRVTDPIPCGEVDPCLIPFALRHHVPTHLINGRKRERLIALLNGCEVTGTVIGTTF
jgi:hypothetical protein